MRLAQGGGCHRYPHPIVYSLLTRRVLYAKLGADRFERVERTTFARLI
jgi:hypothetical protein